MKDGIRSQTLNLFYKFQNMLLGVFANYVRDEPKDKVEANGGTRLSFVSGKLDYLLAGDKLGPSKLQKAQKLGVAILTEQGFEKLLMSSE